MTDAVVLAALLGVVGGIVLSAVLLLARRYARGAGGLGSEAEEATYRALHQASLAAPYLRGGLDTPDVARAAKHLRAVLGSRAVVLVVGDVIVARDGQTEGLDAAARRIAAQV
ncbi:sensor histidine kinase, partial [Microbacterium sp. CnD16-F]|nr:sensor histidine kinase [Microbacterium sp. CnD16-F]